MMSYEAGFSLGERQAWEDRKAGKPLEALGPPQNDLQRGYADGYTPRSSTWARISPTVAWWSDRRISDENQT